MDREWARVNGAESEPVDGLEVGMLVTVQLYSPGPDPIRPGNEYGPPRVMLLRGLIADYGGVGVTRYWCADPQHPNRDSSMSWSESDWAVVAPMIPEGALF